MQININTQEATTPNCLGCYMKPFQNNCVNCPDDITKQCKKVAINNTITVHKLHSGYSKIDFDLSHAGFQLKDATRDKIFDLCQQYAGVCYVAEVAITCGYITDIAKTHADLFEKKLRELLTDLENVELIPSSWVTLCQLKTF